MFDEIQAQVKEYYDDDARHVLERHDGKLYFIWSNHHNAQLFVIICDDTPQLIEAIDAADKAEKAKKWGDPIVYTIKKVMMANGGVKLGEDD